MSPGHTTNKVECSRGREQTSAVRNKKMHPQRPRDGAKHAADTHQPAESAVQQLHQRPILPFHPPPPPKHGPVHPPPTALTQNDAICPRKSTKRINSGSPNSPSLRSWRTQGRAASAVAYRLQWRHMLETRTRTTRCLWPKRLSHTAQAMTCCDTMRAQTCGQ
jgi:hypothetical protein